MNIIEAARALEAGKMVACHGSHYYKDNFGFIAHADNGKREITSWTDMLEPSDLLSENWVVVDE